jgi:hypothetical protein
MSFLNKVLSFVRWRIIFIRYITRLQFLDWHQIISKRVYCTKISEHINSTGYYQSAKLSDNLVEEIRKIYYPRVENIIPLTSGSPFVNLFRDEDITLENPIVRLAFSKEILDIASDYYSGFPLLSTIQVLYAWPSNSEIRESQKWHKDYSDSKSLHCMIYLDDVLSPEDGPFVFVDKQDSLRIKKSLIIRRIDDEKFNEELGSGIVRYFYGEAGSTMFVDPSPVYHYAHRTNKNHLGIFITFSTLAPYAPPIHIVKNNSLHLLEIATQVRPDLSKSFLKMLLQA